mmetsp:Transcript_18733/g.30602  ORF Transcript_18733/g.30602 Transcript_18733/m.30602 type:complete len:90 (-) Transcript_18733:1663-1932(-)
MMEIQCRIGGPNEYIFGFIGVDEKAAMENDLNEMSVECPNPKTRQAVSSCRWTLQQTRARRIGRGLAGARTAIRSAGTTTDRTGCNLLR